MEKFLQDHSRCSQQGFLCYVFITAQGQGGSKDLEHSFYILIALNFKNGFQKTRNLGRIQELDQKGSYFFSRREKAII